MDLSLTDLHGAILGQANLEETQLTNLVSINGADFTDVENLSGETRDYLHSIAAGTHPETKRETHATLSGPAPDKVPPRKPE